MARFIIRAIFFGLMYVLGCWIMSNFTGFMQETVLVEMLVYALGMAIGGEVVANRELLSLIVVKQSLQEREQRTKQQD